MSKSREKFPASLERIHLRQYRRLFDIHTLVVNQKYPNAQQLAEKLEVDVRTVRRAIAFMRDSLNAPVKYCPKRKGYHYTQPYWEMPLVPLTEGELLAFFIATIALQGTGSIYEDARLRRAIAKIATSLPEEISVSLGYLFENISFQAPPHVLVEVGILDKLREAAGGREIVSFDYFTPARSETKNRRAEPLLLHNFEGTWYVVAFDHASGEYRTFHAGRISNLQLTGEYFAERRDFDKEEYLNRSFSMYRGGELTEVEIIFDEYQSHWMRERNYFHPQEQREELPDGRLKLSFTIGENGLEAVARFCLQYAGHCTIENPQELKDLVIKNLKKGIEMNDR